MKEDLILNNQRIILERQKRIIELLEKQTVNTRLNCKICRFEPEM